MTPMPEDAKLAPLLVHGFLYAYRSVSDGPEKAG
jgi:hypothetical protein